MTNNSRLLTDQEASRFNEIITNYQPNIEVLEQFRSSNFAAIAGPAGAGKDTLRNGLTRRWPDKYLPILSTTTRPMRPGEQDNVDYHFRGIDEVEHGLERHEYFKAALIHSQQISCLHADEVRKLQSGQWGLSILIPFTISELSEIKPDIKTIFVVPPSVEILRARINAHRNLSEEELVRRLTAAKKEITTALNETVYYCLISDDETEVEDLAHEYLQNEHRDEQAEVMARKVLEQLMVEL